MHLKLPVFKKTIGQSLDVSNFILAGKATQTAVNQLKKDTKDFEVIIIAIHDTRGLPGYKLNYSNAVINLINELAKDKKAILTLFGNPYTLSGLESLEELDAILVMYENNWYTQKVASNIILGKTSPKGKLPVTVTPEYPIGSGLTK